MKFILEGPIKDNIHSLMRKAGYHFQREDVDTSDLVFVRPPRGFPRFHLYLKTEGENLIMNLHLDQKKPIYKGAPAHSGEYDSEIVKKEVERVKEIAKL